MAGFNFSPQALTLNVIGGLPGDFDFDGDVDGRVFLAGNGVNHRRPLSASDLADWQANYGVGMLSSIVVAVPEPPSTGLLLSLIACFGASSAQKDSILC